MHGIAITFLCVAQLEIVNITKMHTQYLVWLRPLCTSDNVITHFKHYGFISRVSVVRAEVP
jgi:hypothetical protein